MVSQRRMLQGYRVLDFTHFVSGPACTRILCEMGAEVIKVERAPGGDRTRALGISNDGQSTYYFQHNQGKRSLALDFGKPGALDLLKRLVGEVDVMVENFAPGVIGNLGLGYETVSAINPRIVMCSISVAGQTGSLSHKPGYDFVGQAYSGVTDLIGEPGRSPVLLVDAVGDVSTGMAGAMAIGFALIDRERTGCGQLIDASILDTYFHMHDQAVALAALRPQHVPHRCGSQHPYMAPCGIYKAGTGYVFLIALPHEWPRLLAAMNRPELADDPRFGNLAARLANAGDLQAIIEDWLATFPDARAAVELLDRHRVPCAEVLDVPSAINHPHLRERKTVREVENSRLGRFVVPGMPVKFSDWPDQAGLDAPLLGQDNRAVLRDLLGASDEEISRLYAEGVLASHPDVAQAG